jgi:hypothetical protein
VGRFMAALLVCSSLRAFAADAPREPYGIDLEGFT